MLLLGLSVLHPLGTSAVGQQPASIASARTPATVTILVFDAARDTIAQASGFIVRSDGIVVTNWHALVGGTSATVVLPTQEQFDRVAFLDGDSVVDVALIKIPGFDLPTMPIRTTSPEIGERVVVIGSPLGLSQTVTDGIVSAKRIVGGRELVQMSAPISPGSSGAPVLDEDGRAFAIAIATLEAGQQLNFAVPVRYAMGLLRPSIPEQALAEVFGTSGASTGSRRDLRVLVAGFLAAAQRGDLAAMAQMWGTAERGPAADYMEPTTLRRRLTIIAMYLRHDDARFVSEEIRGSSMKVKVRLHRGNDSAIVPFTVVRSGAGGRLISNADLVAADRLGRVPLQPPRPTVRPRASLTGSYFVTGEGYDADGERRLFHLGCLRLGDRIGILRLLPSYSDSTRESFTDFVSSSRTNAQGQVAVDVAGTVFDGFQTDAGFYGEAEVGQAINPTRFQLTATKQVLPLSANDGIYRARTLTTYYNQRGEPYGPSTEWLGELAVLVAGDSIWVDLHLVNGAGGRTTLRSSGAFIESRFSLVSPDKMKQFSGQIRNGVLVANWIDRRGDDRFEGRLEAERF